MKFDLKLASGRVVQWEGDDGEHAARRYVDAHREETVVAWRTPRWAFVPGFDPRRDRIIETLADYAAEQRNQRPHPEVPI